jgi:hypothetical protein
VRILALAYAFYAAGFATEPVLSLAGQVRILPRTVLLYALFGTAITLLAAPYGVIATAWAQVISAAVIFGANTWVFGRFAGIGWGGILWQARFAVPALIAAVVPVMAVSQTELVQAVPAVIQFVLGALIMTVVYCATLLLIDRDGREHLLKRHRNKH